MLPSVSANVTSGDPSRNRRGRALNEALLGYLQSIGGRLDAAGESIDAYSEKNQPEYDSATGGVGLCAIDAPTIRVTGGDRLQFINNLCSNDVKGLSPGHGVEAFFLDPKGRAVSYGVVYLADDHIDIQLAPGQADVLLKHLDRYLITEDVQLQVAPTSLMHLVGPQTGELLTSLGIELPSDRYGHKVVDWNGAALLIRRHPRSIEGGVDLEVAEDQSVALFQRLLEAGSALELRPIGQQALEAVRIEAGLPLYGVDLGPTTLPQEVGRDEQAISFTKGCYLGQETVARLDSYGHTNRNLRGLVIETTGPIDLPASIVADNKTVGQCTSMAHSPRCCEQMGTPWRYIGLGMVRRGHCDPGQLLHLETDVGRFPVKVAALPIVGSTA